MDPTDDNQDDASHNLPNAANLILDSLDRAVNLISNLLATPELPVPSSDEHSETQPPPTDPIQETLDICLLIGDSVRTLHLLWSTPANIVKEQALSLYLARISRFASRLPAIVCR